MIEDAPAAYLVYAPVSTCVVCQGKERAQVTRIDLLQGGYRATEWKWYDHIEVWVEGREETGWSHYKIRLCKTCEPTFRVNLDSVVKHMQKGGDIQDLTDTQPPEPA